MDGSRELPPNPTPTKNIPQNVPFIKKTATSFLPRLDVAVFLLMRPPAKNYKKNRKLGKNSSLCDIPGTDKYK